MILQSAKLVVTDADLAKLIAKSTPPDRLSGIIVKIKQDAIYVYGSYDTGIPVFKTIGFETTWTPTVKGELLSFTFQHLHVTAVGIQADWLKERIMESIAQSLKDAKQITVAGQVLTVDATNLYISFNLTAFLLEDGQLTVIAGS